LNFEKVYFVENRVSQRRMREVQTLKTAKRQENSEIPPEALTGG